MDDGAVAEDPAVELQAGEEAEVEVVLAHRAALGGQEVVDQLLARGLRAPGVVAQVPRELQRGRALAGDVPVEQDDAPVEEAEVVVAQIAVDQGGAAGAQGVRERLRVGEAREHGLGDVVVGRLREGLPGGLDLLGDDVAAGALDLGQHRRGDAQVGLQRDGALEPLPAEGGVHGGRRRHDLAVALAADRPLAGQQRIGEVAHQDPPAVAVGLDGDDSGPDRRRQSLEDARVPQLGRDRGRPAARPGQSPPGTTRLAMP